MSPCYQQFQLVASLFETVFLPGDTFLLNLPVYLADIQFAFIHPLSAHWLLMATLDGKWKGGMTVDPKDVPYFLLGAMSTIREETKKTVDDLVEKGKSGSSKSAKGLAQTDKAVRDLVDKGRKEREDLLNAIGKEVNRVLDNIGADTKNAIRSLEKKLANIEKKVK